MAKVLAFPQQANPALAAMKAIEARMGVSFSDYMGFTGNKQETNERVARAMKKETMKIATKQIEENIH
ncbi:hypothetical protein [Paenibacillus sp. 1P03SA]|uniref:hypothetical protein n=1 Tax=Paenibacillus sp. 1P03SA TaxID=3132294 RepID=UPI0039A2EA2C